MTNFGDDDVEVEEDLENNCSEPLLSPRRLAGGDEEAADLASFSSESSDSASTPTFGDKLVVEVVASSSEEGDVEELVSSSMAFKEF